MGSKLWPRCGRAIALAWAVCALTIVHSARAQQPAPAQVHQILKEQGDKRRRDRREEALVFYNAALEAGGPPTLHWDVAELLTDLGQREKAKIHLDLYETNLLEEERQRKQEDIARLRKRGPELPGQLVVKSVDPKLRLFLDGREVVPEQVGRPLAVVAGDHRVEAYGAPVAGLQVMLRQGEVQQLTLSRPPEPRRVRVAGTTRWVLGGAGLAGLVVGGALGLLDRYRLCPTTPVCPDQVSTAPATITLLSLGAAATIGSMVLFRLHERWSRPAAGEP